MSWSDPREIVKPLIKQRTVEGLAEAIMIAALNVKKDGKLIALRLGNNLDDSMDFARQMAEILLDRDVKDLIVSQTEEIHELKNDVRIMGDAFDAINRTLYCIGGPLNDNSGLYSGEQLTPFFRIANLIKEAS